MSDSDYSSYILRYNLISKGPEYWAGQDWYSITVSASGYLPLTGGTLTGALIQLKAPVLNDTALGTTGTITPDGTLGPTFKMTLTGNVTLNGPSSPVDGQKVTFVITNDASHVVTLATGAGNFSFGADITDYAGTPSLTDYVGAIYNSTANRWNVVAVSKGY
jgi:hypothetical protein